MEIIKFNMDIDNQYGTLKIQIGLLKLIKEFHQFCEEQKIKYSLSWGSLLWAVRHQGFIPWDDDLDVMMNRNNYNILKQKIKNYTNLILEKSEDGLWVDRVRLSNYKSDEILLPTLDIFILDNAPNSKINKKIRIFKILMLQGMLKKHPNFSKGSFIMRCCSLITWFLGKLFSDKYKLYLYSKWSQKSNNIKTEYLGSYNTEFDDLHKLYDYDIMDEYIKATFEDTEVSIIKKYDSCLRVMFGNDYMTPPKNKKPRHLK